MGSGIKNSHIPNTNIIFNRLRMRQLALLIALDQFKSIRLAAENISITQPAASKMIMEMEQAIGLPLFERHRKGVVATRYGEILTRYAKNVFADLGGIRDELVAVKSGNIGRIRIGSIMATIPSPLNQTLVELKQMHPLLTPSVQIDTSDVLVNALNQDQLDVVIGRFTNQDHESIRFLKFDPLVEEELSIISCVGHEIHHKKNIKLQDIISYPWIFQAHPSPMRKVLEHIFIESGVAQPINIIETSSLLLTMSLMHGSNFFAVLPTSLAKYYEEFRSLKIVKIKLNRKIAPYGIITKTNTTNTPAVEIFIKKLKENMYGSMASALCE